MAPDTCTVNLKVLILGGNLVTFTVEAFYTERKVNVTGDRFPIFTKLKNKNQLIPTTQIFSEKTMFLLQTDKKIV